MLSQQTRLSVRSFLIDEHDRIYRFPLSKLQRMTRDPGAHPYVSLAGKRARCAEAVVEFAGSRPVRIMRIVYFILIFDEKGVLNKELHMQQQVAKYNLYLNAQIPDENPGVIDAKNRFLTSGGEWKPAPVLEERICAAALGKLKSLRLQA
jgi:hypothetical protein